MMSFNTSFESRTGTVHSGIENIYGFVTDMRNFGRFIPEGAVSDYAADSDSCSFSVAMAGRVSLRIAGREENSLVVYDGDALGKEHFRLTLFLAPSSPNETTVRMHVGADLNPILKMVASSQLERLLEALVSGMENFNGWNEVR